MSMDICVKNALGHEKKFPRLRPWIEPRERREGGEKKGKRVEGRGMEACKMFCA
jgi:hypothetical protein